MVENQGKSKVRKTVCPLTVCPLNVMKVKLTVDNVVILHFLCRDRLTQNDSIGTTYLNLGKIASSGGEIEGMVRLRSVTLRPTISLSPSL